jgi:hypothetical protein
MTIYVATQDGDWSDTATWGGSGPPGDGDSAHIPSGIDVTVDVNTTVGYGEALTAPQASASNITSVSATAGGSLPNGSYWFFYTNVDASANESGPCGEASVTLGGGNNTITFTMPALPGGISSRNIYLSDANGTTFTGRLYRTGETGTSGVTLSSASWMDASDTYANATRPKFAILIHGTLTLAASVTLTCKGDVIMANAPITQGAGSDFVMNVPASTTYYVLTGTDSGQASALWTINGTSGSVAGVSRTGSGAFQIKPAMRSHSGGVMANSPGGFLWTYVDVDDLGSSSVDALIINDLGGRDCTMDHVIFDGCGRLQFDGVGTGTSRWQWLDTTVRASVSSGNCISWESGPTTISTGSRDFKRCVIDGDHRYSKNGFNWEHNIQHGARNEQGATPRTFKNNFVVCTAPSPEYLLNISHEDNCFLGYAGNSSAFNNWHCMINSGVPAARIVSTRTIFDCPYSTGGGDLLYMGGIDVDARNCIVLPDITGAHEAGDLLNMAKNGGSTNTYSVEHCTAFAANGQGVALTESAGYLNMLTSFKSNIGWSGASSTGYFVTDLGTDFEDTLSAANATHNVNWRLTAGSEGGGYDTPMSGTPGGTDIVDDPGFEKADANILTWGVSLGISGANDVAKITNTLTEMKKKNDRSGFDTNYTVANYAAYIQDSMRPTNTDLEDAGHDGVTIGAVEMAAQGGGGGNRRRRLLSGGSLGNDSLLSGGAL